VSDPVAYTITEFCDAYKLSRPFYFRIRNAGRGPVETRIGAKVLIGRDQAEAWFEAQRHLTGELAEAQADIDARLAKSSENAVARRKAVA
jgi:hypothetical protein